MIFQGLPLGEVVYRYPGFLLVVRIGVEQMPDIAHLTWRDRGGRRGRFRARREPASESRCKVRRLAMTFNHLVQRHRLEDRKVELLDIGGELSCQGYWRGADLIAHTLVPSGDE